jgi:hypothetical protein
MLLIIILDSCTCRISFRVSNGKLPGSFAQADSQEEGCGHADQRDEDEHPNLRSQGSSPTQGQGKAAIGTFLEKTVNTEAKMYVKCKSKIHL